MNKPRLDSTCIRIRMNTKSALDKKAGKHKVPMSLLVEALVYINDNIISAALAAARDKRQLDKRQKKLKKSKQQLDKEITAKLKAMRMDELLKIMEGAKKLGIEPLIRGLEQLIELRNPVTQ